MTARVLALVSALLIPASPLLQAHHSFAAEYDANKPVKVTGVVTKVEWTNPHIWFYVDVKDEQGKVTNWGFSAGPPGVLQRRGISRDAIAEWARITYGWLGRAPDYKAAFLATLGVTVDFYKPYHENARRWYEFSQERVPFVNHAIIHPPVDRHKPPHEVGDVYVHVEKETDAGIVVSGAKVVATGSALTNYTFIAHHGLIPVGDKRFAAIFMIPITALSALLW